MVDVIVIDKNGKKNPSGPMAQRLLDLVRENHNGRFPDLKQKTHFHVFEITGNRPVLRAAQRTKRLALRYMLPDRVLVYRDNGTPATSEPAEQWWARD